MVVVSQIVVYEMFIFLGQLDDWKELKKKIENLKKYTTKKNKSWPMYIDGILDILDQFILTYQRKPNKEFWNKIMNFEDGVVGSGSTTYVSGWILNFFYGLSKKVELHDIPSFAMDFPIEIDNKQTGIVKTVYLVGGFGGILYEKGAFRPQQSMIICEGAFDQ